MAQKNKNITSADEKKKPSSSLDQAQNKAAQSPKAAPPQAAAPLPQGVVQGSGHSMPSQKAPKAAAPSAATPIPPKETFPAPIAAKAAPTNHKTSEPIARPKPQYVASQTTPSRSEPPIARPVAPKVDAKPQSTPQRTPKPEEPRLAAAPARKTPSLSGAKPSIGGLIYALNAKPSNKPYKSAALFSAIWVLIGGLLGWVLVGQKIGDFEAITDIAYTPAVFIILACILIPIGIAWMMATLAVRAQEMKLMASAMTEVAIRLAEPDKMAEQKVASLGQTIRRQVFSVDDAIEQSIDRAGELESKVNEEVAALEQSYNRNEAMMQGLIANLAEERQALLKHGKEVVEAIGQVGNLVDQKLIKSSGNVAQSLAKKSAEAAHKLHQANEVVTSKLESINKQVTDNIPEMMDKLVSEQARMDKVVLGADTSLKKLHGNLANQTNLLAKQSVVLTTQSDTLKDKTDALGKSLKEQTDRMDQVIDTHSKKMNKSLTQRVLALDSSLAKRAQAIDLTLDNRSKTLNESLSQKALDIDSSLTNQTAKLASTMASKAADMDAALDQKTALMSDSLTQKAAAMDQAMAEKAKSMDNAIGQRMVEMNHKLDNSTQKMNNSLSDHVATLDQSLGEKAIAMDAAFSQKARALDASLENKARTIDKSLTNRISQIDSSMSDQANAMSATLGLQTSKMKRTLDEHSSTIENSLQAQTSLLDKTLAINNQSIQDQTDQFSMASMTAGHEKKRLEEERHKQQQQALQHQEEKRKQQQASQQTEKLQQSSTALLNNIQDLTRDFETQGIALLDDAKTLEAAIVQGAEQNPDKNLQQLSDKTTQLDQTKLLFTQQMQQALAQTQQEAQSVKHSFAADPTMTGQQKLQEVVNLEDVAKRQTESAVAKLQDNFVLVTQQVSMSLNNAQQHQATMSQGASAVNASQGHLPSPKARKKAKGKRSSWSMGDLLSSSANRDPDTPTYKPASSSQGAAQDSVSMDPLDVLRMDEIARAIDAPTATNAWLHYQNGERNVFTRNLYNADGQLTFDRIQGRYQTDMSFRDTVERYVQDYEGLLSEVENSDPSGDTTSSYLTTETGRVYLMLAHISGRLG